MAVDHDRFMEFLGKFVDDIGATMSAGNVVVGHRLGLYRALGLDATTPAELATRTGTDPRYVAEWLRGQAAAGYVTRSDTGDGAEAYRLSEEQAFALADPTSPVDVPAGFVLALGALRAEPRVVEAIRTGGGIGWREQDADVLLGTEQFFRAGYRADLTTTWLPALDGVVEKLEAGGRVVDMGCGLGASTVLMAQAYPKAHVSGSDYHDGSIELARKRAAEAGVGDRVAFEVASAQDFSGTDLDLVTSFDCLHDMGDPVGAARHVRQALARDGTWMIVEPFANDDPADNLNPVGRVMYGFSTFLCLPNAFSQPGGERLGAQAGEAAIRRVATEAGFTRFRRVAETPFNLVFEARP